MSIFIEALKNAELPQDVSRNRRELARESGELLQFANSQKVAESVRRCKERYSKAIDILGKL